MKHKAPHNLAGKYGLRHKTTEFGARIPTEEPSEYFQKNFNGNTVRPGKGLSKKDIKKLLLGITVILPAFSPQKLNKYSRIRPRR